MRYAIKDARGVYLTECEVVGHKESKETDQHGLSVNPISREPYVYQRHILSPVFHSFRVMDAMKFDAEQDANDMMKNPWLQDPNAFAGCTVESGNF